MHKKHYCYIPFEGITIDPRGKAQLCPVWTSSPGHDLHDLTKSSTTIEKLFYGQHMENIREKMLKDDYVSACESCYKKERQDLRSHRLKYAEDRIDTVNNAKIKFLDISFSNQCNLGCAMCNSIHSSHWSQQEKTMPADLFKTTQGLYDYHKFKPFILSKEFLDSLYETLPDLEFIVIKGGEPLYDKNCLAFLKKVSEVKPDLTIKLVSNITILPERTLQVLSDLKNIEITASIDGIGKVYNWIRGFDFKKVDKNFQTLASLPNIKKLSINYTTTIYNIENMFDTMHHFKKYQSEAFHKKRITFSIANEPYFHIKLLSNKNKKNILAKIESKQYPFIMHDEDYNAFKKLLDINHKGWPTPDVNSFIKYTKWMNEVRGFNIANEVPHIDRLLNEK